jgi:hypothetical protein
VDWLEANTRTVLSLLRSIEQATALVYDTANDAMVLPIMMEVTQSDANYAKRALDYMRTKSAFARSLDIPATALDKSLQLMVKAGLLAPALVEPARQAWDPRWTAQTALDAAI